MTGACIEQVHGLEHTYHLWQTSSSQPAASPSRRIAAANQLSPPRATARPKPVGTSACLPCRLMTCSGLGRPVTKCDLRYGQTVGLYSFGVHQRITAHLLHTGWPECSSAETKEQVSQAQFVGAFKGFTELHRASLVTRQKVWLQQRQRAPKQLRRICDRAAGKLRARGKRVSHSGTDAANPGASGQSIIRYMKVLLTPIVAWPCHRRALHQAAARPYGCSIMPGRRVPRYQRCLV
jgi:hypothetical protein